jgi:O-antigen ligase
MLSRRADAAFHIAAPGSQRWLGSACVLLAAVGTGVALPGYVAALGPDLTRLMLLPAALAALAVVVMRPRAFLLLALVTRASADLIFESSKVSIGGFQLGLGGVVNAAVLLTAALLVLRQPQALPRRTLALMWGPFLAVAAIATVQAPQAVDAVKLFLAWLSYGAVFASAFCFVKSVRDFRFCAGVVLCSSLAPSLYACAQLAMYGLAGGARLQGTFTHPNIFAFYLTVVISLTLYVLKSRAASPRLHAALCAYMLLLLGLLVLTQTRSAWVACAALFIAYGALFERRYIAYAALAGAIALLIPTVSERLIDLSSGNEYIGYAQLNSFAWRRMLWEAGLSWMAPARYLLGYGLDAFKYHSISFFPLAGGIQWGAHSAYVQCLFEMGAAGLAAYVWLFARVAAMAKGVWQADRLGAFVALVLIVEYLTMSFSDNMFAYLAFNWYVWFMLGAACAAALRAQPAHGAAAAA